MPRPKTAADIRYNERRKTCPKKRKRIKIQHVKRTYIFATENNSAHRMTEEDYMTLYNNQLGRCAMGSACISSNDGLGLKFDQPFELPACVDHDHNTGLVRGILCSLCNLKLHNYENKDREFMECANAYIEGHITWVNKHVPDHEKWVSFIHRNKRPRNKKNKSNKAEKKTTALKITLINNAPATDPGAEMAVDS